MQHMFQQSLVLFQFINRVVDIPAAADLGTHSAHCANRGLSQVQFLAGCGRACCCAITGAPVGRAENCGVSAVAVVGRRPVLGQSRCARLCNDWGAQCLVRLWILAPFYQGGLWKNLYDFLREGVDSGS